MSESIKIPCLVCGCLLFSWFYLIDKFVVRTKPYLSRHTAVYICGFFDIKFRSSHIALLSIQYEIYLLIAEKPMKISTTKKSEKEYKILTEFFVVALCPQNSFNIDRTNLIFAFDSHFMFDSTVNCASMVIIRIDCLWHSTEPIVNVYVFVALFYASKDELFAEMLKYLLSILWI